MANANEQTAKGCAMTIVVLLIIGSCCNSAIESCTSSSNKETQKSESVMETTSTSIPSAENNKTSTVQASPQPTEPPKQENSVNILAMIKTIPDDVRIVGVFEVLTDNYQMIYCRKGIYYMQSICTADNGTWGESERMVKTSSKSYRFYEDTGEEFYLTGYSLVGYADGAEACEWQQVI